MTLKTYNFAQGTPEWEAARRGIVTASVVGKLITLKTLKTASNDESRGLTMSLAAERITDHTEPTFANFDMQRGIDDEPIARDLYGQRAGVRVEEVGFMTEDRFGFTLGYSPDGLVGDEGLIEIKSRRQKTQLSTFLADLVPLVNMPQIQAGLLVSGRAWCDYVSYSGGMPLYVKRVFPDPKWQDAIVAAVSSFEANVAEIRANYAEAVSGLPTTDRIDHSIVELRLGA